MDDRTQAAHDAAIPNAPWHLRGSACVSLWRLPRVELGKLAPDPGLPLLTVAGNAFVATIWAQYSGGTLRYDELAVAVLVRGKGLLVPAGTVTAIWVDDAVSAEGGRRLWHIPKALARFETLASGREFAGKMTFDEQRVAVLRFEPGAALPGRPGLSGFVVQPGVGGPLRTRCTVKGALRTGRAHWAFSPSGPLGVLHGRRPLLSVGIREMDAAFGV
ncbi:MAG TPA: acetoacetate decarboxylase [Pseudomonas sp.]|nr:acetoacetate decarboxylase [Pseudomonas sp.]